MLLHNHQILLVYHVFMLLKVADQTLTDVLQHWLLLTKLTDGSNGGRTINKGGLYANNKFTVTATTTGIYYFYCNIFFRVNRHWRLSYVLQKNGNDTQQVVYSNADGRII